MVPLFASVPVQKILKPAVLTVMPPDTLIAVQKMDLARV
jgi:hypothetical protein